MMNREQIKLLAIIAMTVNHTAFALVPKGTMLYEIMIDIGYLTAVTMCYFLVEGYYYTRSKAAYMQRLLTVAVISQVPYTLALGLMQLNMMFTLLICFVVLWVMDKVKQKVLMIILVCILFCMTYFCDWAFKAVVFTVLFNVTYRQKQSFIIPYSAVFFIQFTLSLYGYMQKNTILWSVVFAFGSAFGIIVSGYLIIKKYNGKCADKHKSLWKWLFYIYYPAHLLLLWLLKI